MQGIVNALALVQTSLGSWGAREFGDLSKKVKKVKMRLERLRAASVGQGSSEEENVVASILQEALRQEDV